MNRLGIFLGGHNLLGDDLLFLQEQHEKVFVALCQTTGENLLAITGVKCTIVGPNISWTAGWVYHNGEIYQVDAGIAPYPANNTFSIVQSVDPAGNQNYEDLNAESTYILRKMTISGNAAGPLYFENLKHLSDFYLNTPAGWSSIAALPTVGNWVAVNGGGNVAGFRISQDKEVHLNGEVLNGGMNVATDLVMFTLPDAPGKKLTFLCAAVKNGTRTFIHVEIHTTGEVKPLGLVNTDVVTIFLDSIRYPLDWSGII